LGLKGSLADHASGAVHDGDGGFQLAAPAGYPYQDAALLREVHRHRFHLPGELAYDPGLGWAAECFLRDFKAELEVWGELGWGGDGQS
jgi:hypothetical protein